MNRNGASACPARAFSPTKSGGCSTWRGARRGLAARAANFRPRHFVVPLARNFRYSPDVQDLVEDFLQYLRHERGQAEHTQKTYSALLIRFIRWAQKHGLNDWHAVELKHLMSFLQHERERPLADAPPESTKRLSSESVYLEIAALR